MEVPEVQPPAPAPPVVPVTPAPTTAVHQAVADDDFSRFRTAERAERAGKPLEAKPAAPVADPPAAELNDDGTPKAPAAPERQLSRKQQDINDRAQRAVENATAQLQRENAELRQQLAAPRREPNAPAAVAAADATDPEPDPADLTKYPDGSFDTKFIRDLGKWSARAEHRALQATEQQQRQATSQREQDAQRARDHVTRVDQFAAKVDAAVEADPKALDGIDPSMRDLVPTIDLKPNERATPLNGIADALLLAKAPVALMRHLSKDNRAELTRLQQITKPAELFLELGRLDERLSAKPPAAAPHPNTVTDAPEPPVVLGRRPSEPGDPIRAAVAANDFGAFRKEQKRERAAKGAA